MKKLVFFLIAIMALTVSCTKTNLEDDTYENNLQLIDKNEVVIPTDKNA